MPLKVRIGQASLTGLFGVNEDFAAAATPDPATPKGVAFAVADGVGKGRGGGALAESTVRAFLSGWLSSPETWAPARCLADLLEDLNRQAREHHRGAACTLTAAAVTGRTLHLSHAGDSRLWLVRDGAAELLTQDHVWDNPDFRNVLHRAVGLDDSLQVQSVTRELKAGDRLVACSDGVHKALDPALALAGTAPFEDLDAWCEELVRIARSKGSEDDATLLVLEVESLPEAGEWGLVLDGMELPVPAPLAAEREFDNFRLVSRLGKGQFSQVWLADDLLQERRVVLKVPSAEHARDRGFREEFLREEWLGRRLRHPHVLSVLALEPGRRTHLYYAMPWIEGGSLRRKLDREGPLDAWTAVHAGLETCQALMALHRQGVLHRDLKPDNLLLQPSGSVLLADLGVAQVAAFTEGTGSSPGTASYMAPELFEGKPASEGSEVFALGVTLYELLTRRLPWGEIEPFTQPRFGKPVPPTRWNPDLPAWLEGIVLKAIEPDPARRFQAVSELSVHLERREAVPGIQRSRRRDPERRARLAVGWAILMAVVAVMELILLLQAGVLGGK